MNRHVGLVITVILTSFQFGCAAIRDIGHAHDSLGGKGVARLELAIPDVGEGLCPGSSARLMVTAVTHERKRLITRGSPGGHISWANFDMEMVGGVVSTHGKVEVGADPRRIIKRPVTLRVVLIHNPKIVGKLTVPIRFNCKYTAWMSGRRGRRGFRGDDRSGNTVAGTGAPGKQGQPGPVLSVLLDRPPGQGLDLIRVSLLDSRNRVLGHFFVAPGGAVTIQANGGDGGPGGRGGRNTGSGKAGDGGRGGNGGSGGTVSIRVDPSVQKYKDMIRVINSGGRGGQGGQPGHGATPAQKGNVGTPGQSGKHGPAATRTIEKIYLP